MRKIIVFAFEPSFGAETYVGKLSMVSTVPLGVPSCTLPERQHSLVDLYERGCILKGRYLPHPSGCRHFDLQVR